MRAGRRVRRRAGWRRGRTGLRRVRAESLSEEKGEGKVLTLSLY